MADPQKKQPACWCSSPSMALLLFMVPLILVSGFVSVMGSKSFNWDFITIYPWQWSSYKTSSSSSSSSSSLPLSVAVSPEKSQLQDSTAMDLSSSRVVLGVDHMEEVMLSETASHELNNLSASMDDSQELQDSANWTEEDHGSLNISMEGPQIVPPMYEPYAPAPAPAPIPTREATREEMTNLERLETGLGKARAAIRESNFGDQIPDPEYVPLGPMYRNANAFHRSYLEMEKQFKVYVYEEGEPPLFHNGPCKSIYSMEGNFINLIEMDTQFRTRDPEKAHVYFLPFSVAMLVQFVYPRDTRDFSPVRHIVVDYVDVIGGRYPYWNRSLGADHFMVACHDWGPITSFSIPNLYKNSIRVLCNANTSEGFNPAKDVSFPEINLLTGTTKGFLGGPSPSHRPILAFFAGGLHGPIRPILLDHWENKDENISVHRYLPKGVSYYDMMRKSKYCICPSGYEVASPRIVEAIYAGCVPVLVSDHYVPPFGDVLNWKSFSVEVSVKDIPNLKRILMSISPRQHIRMQRRVTQIRRHFEVNSPPKRFDVYHMILHSVWLRRLNVRVHNYQ